MSPAAAHGAAGRQDARAAADESEARPRPPDDLTCSQNDLASHTGLVTDYHRAKGRTRLSIRTDSHTTARVDVRHPGSEDPSPWFLFRGQPFADSDWSRIEARYGRLRPGVRATAWVCADGRTRVDWEASRE